MHRLWPTLCPKVQCKETHADAQGQIDFDIFTHDADGLLSFQDILWLPDNVAFHLALKVWPMGVASTVSRLPITVKVVPMSSNEEEEGREQQRQQGEAEGESQQQSTQTQRENETAHTGNNI